MADLVTLARLHAALDSVVETEQLIAAIQRGSLTSAGTLQRLTDRLREARELLRALLEPRQPVGNAIS